MRSHARSRTREASVSIAPMQSGIDASIYKHSPPHYAVARTDHSGLRDIVRALPKLLDSTEMLSEEDAIAEEAKAEAVSAVIDNRDVPGRETPLHLAVKLGDPTAVEILMLAGADCSLQNEKGWSSLQEAICSRQDAVAKIIVKHYQRLGWAKWCRRLPQIVSAMSRMRDFYMELSFNFESSVIPLIARMAPSDTYRIWKRGPNLRTDMTISGFDGLKMQRTGQTFLFLGRGSEDGRLPAGSLCVLDHKTKTIADALDGAEKELSDKAVAQEVSMMAQTNLYRPGIDVTLATLVPQVTWMWQEKYEVVHGWRAKVFDMHNVTVSMKTRHVPGAMTDEEFLRSLPKMDELEDDAEEDDVAPLREGHLKKLQPGEGSASTSKVQNRDLHGPVRTDVHENINSSNTSMFNTRHSASSISADDRKGRPSRNRKSSNRNATTTKPEAQPRKPLSSEKIPSPEESVERHTEKEVPSREHDWRSVGIQHPNDFKTEKDSAHVSERINTDDGRLKRLSTVGTSKEREFKKGLRPALWLTPDFPLKIDELLPVLDILANKVKAVRRLRELLTTKLPPGTFPVKIAFPVVPTIRVVITFCKFEEVGANGEFPAPSNVALDDEFQASWLSWIKGPTAKPKATDTKGYSAVESDPFAIPKDYMWNKPTGRKKKTTARN
ncbi:hypothetical protein KP509_31G052600 [Ceratopteris richardii]|uniref:Ankyrin repeat domain-containing protein n=1 Tax=Ceratopteris richardii TaxID=49495 RepID=A0A8T2QXY3_CERRI|nr:hypothetical protein KP509_31G052600 [Ceratopteris richardii]KAH7288992.1 hypothetical protein KP509_31G052600 [Ceratopteris richardii]